MDAELAYLFRHAVLRDAAYSLQLPGDRARLHELAFNLIEEFFGGPAPEPPSLDVLQTASCQSHASDIAAAELAMHAASALEGRNAAMLSDGDYLRDARLKYLRRAAEYSDRQYLNAPASRLWEELADVAEGRSRRESLSRSARAAHNAGQPDRAQTLLQRALDASRLAADRHGEGTVLCALAGLYLSIGNSREAEEVLRSAHAILIEAGDRRQAAYAESNLGVLHEAAGDYDRAELAHSHALQIFKETGDRRWQAMALLNLGIVMERRHRREAARSHYQESLALLRESGDRRTESIVCNNLGRLNQLAGNHSKADKMYREALAIAREAGNLRGEGSVLSNMAGLYVELERDREAEQTFEQAIAIHREVGNILTEGSTLCDCAWFHLMRRRISKARAAWEAGARLLLRGGDASTLNRKLEGLRDICIEQGIEPLSMPKTEEHR